MLKLVWSQMLPNDARGYGKVAQELGWALEQAGAVILGRQEFGWDYKVVVSTPRAWYHADDKTIQKDLIYHTMYDADLLPEDWVDCYNLAGAVWVPSKWSKGVFQRSGVTRPIIVSGYGVDDEIITYTPPPPSDDRPFIFLSVATSLFDRKGAMTAMQAFRQLDAPNARLVLKFNSGYEVTVKDEPNIKCLVGDFSGWEFINLLQRSHCVVYPSSGEGFGLVPLEAMAVGRPVILTNYSGMTEYIDERYCYPLEIEGVQRAELYNRIYNADGSWAMISVDKLRDAMQHIYDNYEEATEKGRLASEYALSHWTWKQAGKRAYRILEEFRYT